jgi:hypothetical protein
MRWWITLAALTGYNVGFDALLHQIGRGTIGAQGAICATLLCAYLFCSPRRH